MVVSVYEDLSKDFFYTDIVIDSLSFYMEWLEDLVIVSLKKYKYVFYEVFVFMFIVVIIYSSLEGIDVLVLFNSKFLEKMCIFFMLENNLVI